MSGFWASCLRKQLPDIYRCNRSNRNRLSFLGGDSDYFFAHYTQYLTLLFVWLLQNSKQKPTITISSSGLLLEFCIILYIVGIN